MDEMIFFDTLQQGLWVAVITSTPILGAALVSGLCGGPVPGTDLDPGK